MLEDSIIVLLRAWPQTPPDESVAACSRDLVRAAILATLAIAVPARGQPVDSARSEAPSEAEQASSRPASAVDAEGSERELDPRRYEAAALPLFGGSTDIGIGAGFIGALTRFEPHRSPYAWRAELKLFSAGKDTGDGFDLAFHDHHVALDLPGDRVRVGLSAYFSRDTAATYYGLGNASPEPPPSAPSRYTQFRWTTPGADATVRFAIAPPVSIFVGGGASWHDVEPYANSKLELDASGLGGERVRSLLTGASGSHALLSAEAGLALDTRDHETVPTRGMFHDLSIRSGRAVGGDRFGFGGVHLTTRFFAPVAGEHLVVAVRVATDLLFGSPPVYTLASMGGLEPTWAPGGGEAVRGVFYGRYAGRIKSIANLELRSMFLRATALEQRFRFGAVAFVDTGRVRTTFEDAPELDGRLPGLKVGVGGGARILWGEAFLARADAAWSPDGVGFYVRTDHIF